jgi:hypothetical protein
MTTTDVEPIVPSDFLRTSEYYNSIRDFISKCMVDKVDYGLIKGTNKPSLYQPGAQKLLKFANLTHSFPPADFAKTENWNDNPPFLHYMVRCVLHDKDGKPVGESYGSCNSREAMYVKQGAAAVANTLVKMAQKRAYVGATVATLGLSQEFTQDMEDIGTTPQYPATEPRGHDVPRTAPRTPVEPPVAAHVDNLARPSERQLFIAASKQMGFNLPAMDQSAKVQWISNLTQEKIDDVQSVTDAQWSICANAIGKYFAASTPAGRELPFVQHACKQLYDWVPETRESLSAECWIYIADHITEVKEWKGVR